VLFTRYYGDQIKENGMDGAMSYAYQILVGIRDGKETYWKV
jgi:hypothetical protein